MASHLAAQKERPFTIYTMCGLTGISIGKKYDSDELKKVKELFTQILLAHEERGREATGVIAVWPDSRYIIVKDSLPASEFVKTPAYLDFIGKLDGNVRTLLGHTRAPTKGNVRNDSNNHPLIIGNTVGVHNGTIKNDDALFKNENIKRIGEVDSEVIFSMLDNIHHKCNYHSHSNCFVSEVQACTQKMTGSFTTISINLEHPHELLLLKYNQPLSYHYSKPLDTLFFTSRYVFLRKAFGRAVLTEALPSRSAYLFDLFANTAPKGQPVLQFPITSANNDAVHYPGHAAAN